MRGLVIAGSSVVAPRLLGRARRRQARLAMRPIASQSVPAPPIVTRAQWGADESLGNHTRSFADITKVLVHHTAIDETDPVKQIQGIQRFHTQTQGWDDIGYNFLIDRAGTVYEGRWARDYVGGETHTGEDVTGRGVVGAHALGCNTGSVGIALLGTYSTATITDATMRSLAATVAWKVGSRNIDPYGSDPFTNQDDGSRMVFPNIAGHRDVNSTGCPGDGMYVRLNELRDLVSDEVTHGLVGLRILGADGSLWAFGGRPTFARANDISDPRRAVGPKVPVRGAAATPTGRGAWVVDGNGSVYSFGDARFFGSMGGQRLNRPVVGMAARPDGLGYWLVATDGGIFTFGSAGFFGSTGALALRSPIVGMASTPTGGGYWLVAGDGGIFSFGDALFFGSTGGLPLAQPIVGMAPSPSGHGYWMVARDGGVFSFGDAPFLGSAVGRRELTAPATAIVGTPSGLGYWVLDSAGTAFTFGDAPVFGSGVTPGSRPALAILPVIRP
ncbi:MAG: hypothetical protein QOI47_568 [Actinomycetota bacterium]|nr:hypothetical protein [Actinomycetota bacterium]